MKNRTKKEAIREHLEKNKNGITSMEAIKLYGDTRLSGTIYELKHKDNLNITKVNEVVKTRYGQTTLIARYKLEEGEHHERC